VRASDLTESKRLLLTALRALARAPENELERAASEVFAEAAECAVSYPTNRVRGLEEVVRRHLQPMRHALPDLERRDDVVIAGEFANRPWIATTGYYYGTLTREWLSLPASDHWLYVRFGEFYRLEGRKVVDAYILLDLIDVMRQLGVNPLPAARGIEGLCPGPATRDGVILKAQSALESRRSSELVDAMIVEGLMSYDQVDHASIGMDRYWHPDMMWYGPGGIGTTRALEGFLKYHQHPWQEAYPDYVVEPAGIDVSRGLAGLKVYHEHAWQRTDSDHRRGEDLSRVAEGQYVAWSGWPATRATHSGRPLFGLEPSGRRFTIRIMDFWRRDGDRLAENWVFIDIPHMLLQLGRDVLAEAQQRSAGTSSPRPFA
jgi:predicted ester cyclase